MHIVDIHQGYGEETFTTYLDTGKHTAWLYYFGDDYWNECYITVHFEVKEKPNLELITFVDNESVDVTNMVEINTNPDNSGDVFLVADNDHSMNYAATIGNGFGNIILKNLDVGNQNHVASCDTNDEFNSSTAYASFDVNVWYFLLFFIVLLLFIFLLLGVRKN